MRPSTSTHPTLLSLQSLILLLCALLPAVYGAALDRRVPAYHLCDGPTITNVSAGPDCLTALDMIAGRENPADFSREKQWFSAPRDPLSPDAPLASRVLPRRWSYGRCVIRLDWADWVADEEREVVPPPKADSKAVVSLSKVHDLARTVIEDCLAVARRPRGYRDVGLMVSKLKVGIYTGIDHFTAMQDPNFVQLANVLEGPDVLEPEQRAGLEAQIRRYLAYGFANYAYPL
jgi:hypothetical protein